jgi:hypothetical protein
MDGPVGSADELTGVVALGDKGIGFQREVNGLLYVNVTN